MDTNISFDFNTRFCPRHGEHRDSKSDPEAPTELMAVAREMVPQLFLRLLYHLREQFNSQGMLCLFISGLPTFTIYFEYLDTHVELLLLS